MAVEASKTTEMEATVPSRRSARRLWVIGIVLAGLVGAGGYVAALKGPGRAQSAAPPTGARAIPVVVSPARSGELGVYLTGIGSVTPFSTVTVRSRVDGQLMRTLFTYLKASRTKRICSLTFSCCRCQSLPSTSRRSSTAVA